MRKELIKRIALRIRACYIDETFPFTEENIITEVEKVIDDFIIEMLKENVPG